MTRIAALLAFVALAIALVLAPLFDRSGTAIAQGSGSGGGVKVCKAKTPEGKTKTWRCGKDQACCVNQLMGSYVCGFPGMGCL